MRRPKLASIAVAAALVLAACGADGFLRIGGGGDEETAAFCQGLADGDAVPSPMSPVLLT